MIPEHIAQNRSLRRRCAKLLRQVAALEAEADATNTASTDALDALANAADALEHACAAWDTPEHDA